MSGRYWICDTCGGTSPDYANLEHLAGFLKVDGGCEGPIHVVPDGHEIAPLRAVGDTAHNSGEPGVEGSFEHVVRQPHWPEPDPAVEGYTHADAFADGELIGRSAVQREAHERLIAVLLAETPRRDKGKEVPRDG